MKSKIEHIVPSRWLPFLLPAFLPSGSPIIPWVTWKFRISSAGQVLGVLGDLGRDQAPAFHLLSRDFVVRPLRNRASVGSGPVISVSHECLRERQSLKNRLVIEVLNMLVTYLVIIIPLVKMKY